MATDPGKSDGARRAEDQHLALAADAAFRAGDLDRLRHILGDLPGLLNAPMPAELGLGDSVLEYAIYWSPVPFVAELIDAGADPNYADDAGFPALIAALSSGRPETLELMTMLIAAGADLNARGFNDWTPLHLAVAYRHLPGVELLLAHGADARLATRIDECTTPLEDAEAKGYGEIAELVRRNLSATG